MTSDPNIGQPLEAVDTPALLVDLGVMERNIARMAAFFKGRRWACAHT